jgi:hypothetical protein
MLPPRAGRKSTEGFHEYVRLRIFYVGYVVMKKYRNYTRPPIALAPPGWNAEKTRNLLYFTSISKDVNALLLPE